MTFAERLLRARKFYKESRADFAKRVGMRPGAIERIERRDSASPAEEAYLLPHILPTEPTPGGLTGPPSPPEEPEEPDPAGMDWAAVLEASVGYSDDPEMQEDQTPTKPEGRLISNSELQTFKDCRRRWWLKWYRGLRLRAEDPLGVRFTGDRLHRALATWYVPEGTPRQNPRDSLERAILEDWQLLVAHHGEQVPEEIAAQFTKDTNLERAMLDGYAHWLAETGADADYDVVASETFLSYELRDNYDRPFVAIGKLDTRLRRRSDGVHLFMDHKTVGDLTGPTRLLPLDEQMLHYHLLEWLNLPDVAERCDGALYNMLRRVKGTAQAKPPFFARVEVRHNEHELGSYEQRLVNTATDLLSVEEELGHNPNHTARVYPRPTRDCVWKCDFFAVCPMFDDGSRVEAALEGLYVKGDPLDYYEELTT